MVAAKHSNHLRLVLNEVVTCPHHEVRSPLKGVLDLGDLLSNQPPSWPQLLKNIPIAFKLKKFKTFFHSRNCEGFSLFVCLHFFYSILYQCYHAPAIGPSTPKTERFDLTFLSSSVKQERKYEHQCHSEPKIDWRLSSRNP